MPTGRGTYSEYLNTYEIRKIRAVSVGFTIAQRDLVYCFNLTGKLVFVTNQRSHFFLGN